MRTPDQNTNAEPTPPRKQSSVTKGAVRNILSNWTSHFVIIIGGFILPRFVKDMLGADRLGVWYFAWSMVSSLRLLNAGVSSSVNRYTAHYQAQDKWDELNRAVSSCAVVFALSSTIAATVNVVLAALLPRWLPAEFAPYMAEAQWLLFFAGLGVALDMASAAYNGVISGHRRYDLLMYIESGCHVGVVAGVIVVMWMGGTLKAVAATLFAFSALEASLKFIFAHRVCPQLKLSFRKVTRRSMREVTFFGAKTFVLSVSRTVMYQGNTMVAASLLGPAALSLYGPAASLVAQCRKLLFQFARVLTPMASEASARGDTKALDQVTIMASQASLFISLPMVITLAILGAPLMRLWMGPEFARLPLLEILAIGHLAAFWQTGPLQTLMGLNRHGLAGAAMLTAAFLSLGLSLLLLGEFHTGIIGVPISMAVSNLLVNLLFTPRVVARSIGLPVTTYFARSVTTPVLMNIPFAAWLLLCRQVFVGNDIAVLLTSALVGGLILLACYWNTALPASLRERMNSLVRRPIRRMTRS